MEASVAFVAGNVFLLYLSWIVTGVVYFQGVSLRTMYRQLADSGPCVMIVEDTQMWTFKGFKEKLYLYIEGNGKGWDRLESKFAMILDPCVLAD